MIKILEFGDVHQLVMGVNEITQVWLITVKMITPMSIYVLKTFLLQVQGGCSSSERSF